MAWSEGRRPLGAVLHSSHEPSEFSQWPCGHDDSTINIILGIVVIVILLYWLPFNQSKTTPYRVVMISISFPGHVRLITWSVTGGDEQPYIIFPVGCEPYTGFRWQARQLDGRDRRVVHARPGSRRSATALHQASSGSSTVRQDAVTRDRRYGPLTAKRSEGRKEGWQANQLVQLTMPYQIQQKNKFNTSKKVGLTKMNNVRILRRGRL